MKRIYVNVTEQQAAALKERATLTGVLQSEQIRRALNLALFADAESNRQAGYVRARKSLEDYEARQQPVLIPQESR